MPGAAVKRWRDLVSTACGLIAAAFLAAMMLLTVADVTLARGVQPAAPRRLRADRAAARRQRSSSRCRRCSCATRTSWSIPSTTWRRAGCRRSSGSRELLSVTVLAVMAWQGFFAARDSFEFHDVTADLGLPRVWHWVAVLSGIIGSAIAALAMALRRTDQPKSRQGRGHGSSHDHRRHRRARRRAFCWC